MCVAAVCVHRVSTHVTCHAAASRRVAAAARKRADRPPSGSNLTSRTQDSVTSACVCVCACVRACVRARARAGACMGRVHACVSAARRADVVPMRSMNRRRLRFCALGLLFVGLVSETSAFNTLSVLPSGRQSQVLPLRSGGVRHRGRRVARTPCAHAAVHFACATM